MRRATRGAKKSIIKKTLAVNRSKFNITNSYKKIMTSMNGSANE